MSIEDNLKEVEKNIDHARAKVQSYKKIRLVIKSIGNAAFVVVLFLELWLAAVMLWMLFFPDLNDFIRFFKSFK